MKKIQKYVVIALTGVLFTSCLGRAIGPNVSESRGNMSADINGKSWRAQEVNAITLFGALVMTGDRNDGSSFGFTFLGTALKEGKYDLPSDIQTGISGVAFTDDNERTFTPVSGTIEITRFRDNRLVEGKFELEGTDFNGNTVSIKNGKFDVTIAL